MNWKRLDYLTHRWIGIAMGLLLLSWFASGIVMMYYPWPMPTPREDAARLRPLVAVDSVIGFDSAIAVADRFVTALGESRVAKSSAATGGRLMEWNGRPVYSLWHERGARVEPRVLVDARTATVLSPISPRDAEGVARSVVGDAARVTDIELLASGDHYLLSGEYRRGFPAYVVHFADKPHTAVYVSREAGYVVGVVTNLTRWTTWLGTVPHWLYFKWLYSRHLAWWLWASYVLPGIALIAGVSGLVIGVRQLFPHWRRGNWRVSAYRGASRWHHLSGIVVGLLVITWSLSGLLEVLGPDGFPTSGQIAAARGREVRRARLTELDVVRRFARDSAGGRPVAVDIAQLLGRASYVVHLDDGRRLRVDGVSGEGSVDLDTATVRNVAVAALGATAPVRDVERLTAYDAYYYGREHRERVLPVWRVSFADGAHSTVYIDAVSGEPVGFVDSETRWYRWLRDGLHSFDFAALNGRHPLWDLVLLPLMLGGTLAAATGVWLAMRRVKRLAR